MKEASKVSLIEMKDLVLRYLTERPSVDRSEIERFIDDQITPSPMRDLLVTLAINSLIVIGIVGVTPTFRNFYIIDESKASELRKEFQKVSSKK